MKGCLGSSGAKAGSSTTTTVEGQRGGDALDLELTERAAGALEGLLAVRAGHDEFGQQESKLPR